MASNILRNGNSEIEQYFQRSLLLHYINLSINSYWSLPIFHCLFSLFSPYELVMDRITLIDIT